MKSTTMATPELPEAARAFADGDVELLPSAIDDAAGEALVALLVERGDAARLVRLGGSADKALAKRARKARASVADPRRGGAGRAQARVPPARALRAVGGAVAGLDDRRARRAHRLAGARAPTRGFDIFEAQLSDTRGILGFTTANAPKKDWRAHTARVVADERMAVARISERHARQLIEDGYRQTLAAGRVPPEEFARARLGMGHYEPEERHPALELAPPYAPGEARGRLAAFARAARAAHLDPARGRAARARSRDRQHRDLQADRRSRRSGASSSPPPSTRWRRRR